MNDIEEGKSEHDSDSMLANLDKVMRQLRRRPQGTRHGGRGTYRLLKVVSEMPGISTRELADKLDIRRASLNEKLVALENESMIKRDRDPDDQRVYVVYLEKSGIDYLDQIQEMRSKKHDAINTILSLEEIQQLAYLAGKIADGFEAIYMENETDNKRDNQ